MNIRNSLILFAALGISIAAYGSDMYGSTSTSGKSNSTSVMAQGETQKSAKLDIDAINRATEKDLLKAVNEKVAKRIIDARTKLGGKFTDEQQLCKKARVGKRQLEKLIEAFPKVEKPAQIK